jgi:CheY-like chemotaxis protein/anti-sigma regulatory factor (Ser/Thr protein kinase)
VRSDEKRLRQILINLLSNAIKFTPSGHVGLSVAYRTQTATFTVSDTGVGIGPGELERVFEPFERGAASGETPGLGLGLTITRLLVEIMGGEITVASMRGVGSTFTVRLLLASVAAPLAAPAARIRGYAGPRLTLMAVDDDRDHQDMMRQMLEPLGFALLVASDGPAALALAAEATPDLFLLDISMPGMSGWQLATALRAAGHASAPILMLSANVGETMPDHGEHPPHDSMLAKPFDLAQLLDRIGALLRLDWVTEAPPTEAMRPVEPLRRPAAHHIEELMRLGEIGYVRGIERKLDELAAEPHLGAFIAELRDHLGRFDFERFGRTLGEARHG